MQIAYRIFFWLFIGVFYLLYLYVLITPGIYLLNHDPKAMDFLAFYTGAKLLSLSPANLYDLHAQRIFQQHISPLIQAKGIFLPFLNPPFVATGFQLLAMQGFVMAYVLLLIINTALFLLVCFVFKQQCKKLRWYFVLAFVIGVITFIPIVITFIVGQFSIFFCVIFLLFWLFLKKGWEFRSGLVFSLLLIKPHFFLLPVLAILVQRRSKLIAGFVTGFMLLFGISYYYVGWTGMKDYFALLNSFYVTGTGYNINLMAQQSLQTLFLIIFHTHSLDKIRIFWFAAILFIIIPTLFIWSKKFSHGSPQFTLQVAILIIATLLTSPHTHFYDLSLLAIVTILLLSHISIFKHGQKKLFITFSILSYFIPWLGYGLFTVGQELWALPSIIFLIIFWLILYNELITYYKSKTLKIGLQVTKRILTYLK
jgi:hypothetical protein